MRAKGVSVVESMVDLSGRGAPQEFQRFAWVQPEHLLMICRDFKRIYYSFVVQDLQKAMLRFSSPHVPAELACVPAVGQAGKPSLQDALQGTSLNEAVDAVVDKFGRSAVLGYLQQEASTAQRSTAPAKVGKSSQPSARSSHAKPEQPLGGRHAFPPSHAVRNADEVQSSTGRQTNTDHSEVDDSFAGIIKRMPAEVEWEPPT